MKRTALMLLIGLCAVRGGNAHEFWIQPSDFALDPRATLSLTLQVGDGPSRQRSPIPPHRIKRFEAIGPAGDPIDLRGTLAVAARHAVTLDEPGSYLLAIETDDRAYSHQSAMRFNEYIEAEGLTPALEHRTQTHQLHVDGFERYSRAAKSIVLVGRPGPQAQAHITSPLGLHLEIVPEVSPYSEPRPARMPVRVIYEGRPLPGALVKLMDLEHDLARADARLTDSTGLATFAMPNSGSWVLSVVWTKRLPNASDADFQTTFASLAFGLPRTAPGNNGTY